MAEKLQCPYCDEWEAVPCRTIVGGAFHAFGRVVTTTEEKEFNYRCEACDHVSVHYFMDEDDWRELELSAAKVVRN